MKKHGPSGTIGIFMPVLALCVILLPSRALSSQWWNPDLSFSGLANLRVASAGSLKERSDGGTSRLRYGADTEGERDTVFTLPEAALEISAQANDWLSAFVHLHHQPEDETALDVVAGYAEITPPPIGRLQTRVKAGAFFPGISRENRDTAWSNSYTLTSSPGMTWIGEDIRPVGVALSAQYLGKGYSVSGEVALFGANDTAGASLALGGWSLTDIKTPLNGRIRHFDPATPGLQATTDPFTELDDRPGYYVRADVNAYGIGALSVFFFDNRVDPASDPQNSALWDTRFAALSAETLLPGEVTAIAHMMHGETRNQTLGVDFFTASLLIARSFGRVDTALRVDHFKNKDLFAVQPIQLAEEGQAVTLSAGTQIGDHHQLTLETVYVSSERSALATTGRQSETLVQLNYRISF